jgi:hypothetical protein
MRTALALRGMESCYTPRSDSRHRGLTANHSTLITQLFATIFRYAPEVATIDPTPCVFTSITPAWSNENLYSLSKKVITPLLFAHVRAATPGTYGPASDAVGR